MAAFLTLRGQAEGTRSVLGQAAHLTETDGRLTLTPELLSEAARRVRRGEEPLPIILIAERADYALAFPVPEGLTVVGVVAEVQHRVTSTNFPSSFSHRVSSGCLFFTSEAREQIAEGLLLLLDPVRGRLLIEPDAQEVARWQATAHRPRFRLGAAHAPAYTQNGHPVAVWTMVRDVADVDTALEIGADGLYVLPGGNLLDTDNDDELLRRLLWLAEQYGGGDLALVLLPEQIDLFCLVRVAAVSVLHWVIPAGGLFAQDVPGVSVAELHQELEMLRHREDEAGHPAQLPRLGIAYADYNDPETARFDELYLPVEDVRPLEPETTFGLPPIRVLFDNPYDDSLTGLAESLVGGVVGVVVPLTRVAEAKQTIRECD